jgi:protein-tyrosine kinase
MSRIHEALKRAEMERIAAQGAGTGNGVPTPSVGGEAKAVTTAAEPQETKPSMAVGGDGPLDFAELQLRRVEQPSWNPDPNADVFTATQSGQGAEQFRTLRSRLYQFRGSHPLHTVLVTSSVAGEGKTFVTSNLARSIVRQVERRVLVIDADLRRPRLHEVFGASPKPGLTDYLRGTADEPSIIQYGGAGNLGLIPTGSLVNDPSELLSNGRLKVLLDRIGAAFDWVILDSPPCLPVADAGIVAPLCDGILLVVKAGFTPSAAILKTRQDLKQRALVGVVLNGVAQDSHTYAPYYGAGQKESAATAAQ